MNTSLLDPHQRFELPKTIEEALRDGQATCTAFNRTGTLLAVGCESGLVIIYDFETRGVVRKLTPASAKAMAVVWGGEAAVLVVALADGFVLLLNVQTGEMEAKAKLHVPATTLSLSSRESRICLASCASGPPQLLDFRKTTICPLPSNSADADGKARPSSNIASIAIFSLTGLLIYSSHVRGAIAILDALTLDQVDLVKVPGLAKISGLALDRQGKHLLVNCSDRVVRLYSLRPSPSLKENRGSVTQDAVDGKPTQKGQVASLQLRREFSNAIERTLWRMAAFTGNGEHVSAASSSPSEHAIYIWDREFGRLEAVLQGPKESVLDIAWHPTRSLLATTSITGTVYIWARVYRENWAAFAPDFEELHDNYEYIEQEDEFDIQEPAYDAVLDADGEEEDGDVDIDTAQQQASDSDDDQETCVRHLLIHIQPDRPAEIEAAKHIDAARPPMLMGEEGSISSSDADDPQPQTAQSSGISRPGSPGLLLDDTAGRRQRSAKGRVRPLDEESDTLHVAIPAAEAKRQKL